MSRHRSFYFTDYLRCPHCGRILTYLVDYVPDRHSPDGWSVRKAPVKVTCRHKVTPDDRPVTRVVSKGKYEGETRTEWEHTCDVECGRCRKIYSSHDPRIVRRECPDGELPAGFWVEVDDG